MRVANQATLQELAEHIDQADAVVIGGGSGLSSAAGYDHYHWSPALSEALTPFREQYGFTSPLAGFYHCFSSWRAVGILQSIYPLPVGSPYGAALSGPAGACCGQTCFCSDHQCGSAVFSSISPETNLRLSGRL